MEQTKNDTLQETTRHLYKTLGACGVLYRENVNPYPEKRKGQISKGDTGYGMEGKDGTGIWNEKINRKERKSIMGNQEKWKWKRDRVRHAVYTFPGARPPPPAPPTRTSYVFNPLRSCENNLMCTWRRRGAAVHFNPRVSESDIEVRIASANIHMRIGREPTAHARITLFRSAVGATNQVSPAPDRHLDFERFAREKFNVSATRCRGLSYLSSLAELNVRDPEYIYAGAQSFIVSALFIGGAEVVNIPLMTDASTSAFRARECTLCDIHSCRCLPTHLPSVSLRAAGPLLGLDLIMSCFL
ncbi:hypothetical protein EVAR_49971_1 [Eumeta japonica]|uniref:Uncharacterized protein n=1 Tax=Eumeta variegata TaxID=151549 RepID=A0A4C1YMC9_EUMVA|nr:hypothetical protein EVAR_49971_1 [Eumeta japonica]